MIKAPDQKRQSSCPDCDRLLAEPTEDGNVKAFDSFRTVGMSSCVAGAVGGSSLACPNEN